MTIVLIRHAETECNTRQIYCTMGADPNLTENGINQAHQAGALLNNIYSSSFDFMAISNLTRTNHTAQIVNSYLNIEAVEYNNDLRERGALRFGINYFNKYGIDKEDHEGFLAGDEDMQTMFIPRVVRTICKYMFKPESLGLLVAHGNFAKAASSYFFGKEIALENCETMIFDRDNIADLAQKCGAMQDYEL